MRKWDSCINACVYPVSGLALRYAVLLKCFRRSISKAPGNVCGGNNLEFLLYAAYFFGYSSFSFKNVVLFAFYCIIKLFEC